MSLRPWKALRAVPLGAALLFALALTPTPAPAERAIVIQRLDAELLVQRDGTVTVAERLQVHFQGSWQGLERRIPLQYDAPGGLNYSLFVRVLGAYDEQGQPLRTQVKRDGAYLVVRIYVPNAADSGRELSLRYRVENGLRYFQGYDELYWNAIGTEWDCPVLGGSVKVLLPSTVSGLRAQAFEGPWGSTERAQLDTAGNNYAVATTNRELSLHEGLTVDVAWNPGVVARPTLLQRLWWLLRSNWGFALPFLFLAILWRLWYTRGRDPRLRPIAPQYEAPEGLTAAEAGTLLDNSPDMRDITAVLVDLAVRGYIHIQQKETSHLLGLIHEQEYTFSLKKPQVEWGQLRPHEVKLLESLFDNGARQQVSTAELKNKFYQDLPPIKSAIFEELVERGYYGKRPDQVLGAYLAVGTLAAIALAAGGAKLASSMGQRPLSFIVGGIISFIIVVIFARIMPARTQQGTRALEGVLGFQEFLRRVESDRFERVIRTPELFEKGLPFAMAFGVAESWARAFDGILREPPSWYTSPGGSAFRASMFASSLSNMSSQTAAAMSSSPRGSSSSSGFGGGGGGFSGGGFGGGGGGGF